jgi:trehalose-6-phosphatase
MSACASQTWENITPAQWNSIKNTIAAKFKVVITTDSGTISQAGFTVTWNYVAPNPTTSGPLTIQVTESPLLIPCSAINSSISGIVTGSQ